MGGKDDCPYQRVEYLECNKEGGWSCINTGYIPNGDDIDIYVRIMPLGFPIVTWNFWIGTYDSDLFRRTYRIMSAQSEKQIIIDFNNTAQYNKEPRTEITHNLNEIYDFKLYGESRRYEVNDKSGNLISVIKSPDAPCEVPLYLFSPVSDYMIYERIYSFRLDKAGVTVLDLIPIRIGDEGFLYDKVSGKLFGNAGTGNFILGPDIN